MLIQKAAKTNKNILKAYLKLKIFE